MRNVELHIEVADHEIVAHREAEGGLAGVGDRLEHIGRGVALRAVEQPLRALGAHDLGGGDRRGIHVAVEGHVEAAGGLVENEVVATGAVDQRPTHKRAGIGANGVFDAQSPGARERRVGQIAQEILRLECAGERRSAIADQINGIVVEGGVGEIFSIDAFGIGKNDLGAVGRDQADDQVRIKIVEQREIHLQITDLRSRRVDGDR